MQVNKLYPDCQKTLKQIFVVAFKISSFQANTRLSLLNYESNIDKFHIQNINQMCWVDP